MKGNARHRSSPQSGITFSKVSGKYGIKNYSVTGNWRLSTTSQNKRKKKMARNDKMEAHRKHKVEAHRLDLEELERQRLWIEEMKDSIDRMIEDWGRSGLSLTMFHFQSLGERFVRSRDFIDIEDLLNNV